MSGRSRRLRAAGIAVCAAVAGGCDRLDYEAALWSIQLVGPLNDAGEVEFCPLLPATGSATFLPPQSGSAVITTPDEDVYEVRQIIFDGSSTQSPAHRLLGTEVSFDIGPSGTPYEANELEDAQFQRAGVGETIVARRVVVGGARPSDRAVELLIELAPDCAGETIESGGSSCDCSTQRFTWKFEALD